MLTPNDAFNRLKKDGAFVEETDNVSIHWYWHTIGGGFKCMARRNLDGNAIPTIFREFHINDVPLTPKRYF